MASEVHPWRFELEIFPSRLPCGHVFEPKLNAQQSTSWCFGSHFFLIDSLPFATVVFWLHLKTKNKFKEKHWTKTPLSTFHCNQLQHTRSACFKTDLPDHFWFNFVQVVTEPCESVVLLWRHGGHVTENGIFSCRRRRCSKRRVCFHSNQYFYVPQKKINLSNEPQRVC